MIKNNPLAKLAKYSLNKNNGDKKRNTFNVKSNIFLIKNMARGFLP